jgi:fibronectin type 3 domain-containing protein
MLHSFAPTNGKWLAGLFLILALLTSGFGSASTGPVHSEMTRAAASAPAGLLQFSSGGHVLGFSAEGMYAATGSHALHVDFLGANAVTPQADSSASPVLPRPVLGKPDLAQAAASLKAGPADKAAPLSQVTYTDLWDGVSLAYTAGAGDIYTTTYTLAPGANPAAIRLHYNAPLSLNEAGSLGIAFETGSMTESAPLAWQAIKGRRVAVEASFRVHNQEVGFALGAYDPGYALMIDPSIIWNTFLGGSGGQDGGNAITVDGSGNVYVTGYSSATWGSPVRLYSGSFDAFAAKLDSSGALVWNTFLGGGGYDYGIGIAVDNASGNVYVTGYSTATWDCFVTCTVRAYTGGWDAFVAKLNSTTGALVWNTFLGGSGDDSSYGIAVDGSGNVYVTGNSDATWSCSPAACTVRAYSGSLDAFAAKLNSSGALTWNTFLGGSGYDEGYAIAVDGSGNAYVTGSSGATWGSPVRVYAGGDDTFAARLDPYGGLTWNTFLGGSGNDEGAGIAVDGNGDVYVAGASNATWGCSPTACTVRAYTSGEEDTSDEDAFAAKLDSSGGLTWNTFLGGSGWDYGTDIGVDWNMNVYVAGTSTDTWGSPVRAFHSGDIDAFAARLNSSGALTGNTFLGGSYNDTSGGIAVDWSGTVTVTGVSYTTWGSPVRAFGGGADDAFVAKVDLVPPTVVSSLRLSTNPSNAGSVNFTVTFSEAVIGVDASDFTLSLTGISGASVTMVSGSGTTYTVTVNTGTGDGTLRLDVSDDDSILDLAGNPLGGLGGGNGNSANGQNYIIDKTAPDTQIDVHPANPSNSANASFTFSSADGTATFECSLEGGVYAACTSPRNYIGLAGGSHTFAVRARDPAGNLDASPASYTWTIDTTAPDTQIDSHPANPSNSANASFTFSSSDVTATFECSLEGGAYAACISPRNYNGLADGSHTFAVRARDPAGNLDASPASYTWTIDTIPPAAPTNVQASDGTYTDKVRVNWSASSGATSYKVYRATSASGMKSLRGSPTGTTFDDTTATPGVTYYYWIKACKGVNCSDYSAYNTGWRKLSAPTTVQASDGTYTDKVRVSWSASSGATSYKVYRATSASGMKSLRGSPTGTTFDDTTATPGVTYYYWVKACKGVNCSDYSAYNTGWRKLSAPTNVQASDGTYTDKVRVSWSASSGATSYKVYRATSASGTKSLRGSPTGTTFDDTTATRGVTYYYWVKACKGTYCSDYSAYNTGWRKP